jgi:hypothetical protein
VHSPWQAGFCRSIVDAAQILLVNMPVAKALALLDGAELVEAER